MNKKEDIFKITIIVFVLDQLIKYYVNRFMEQNTGITVIPNFFSILYIRNRGAAFSILENNTILLIVISVVFLVILDRYIKKETSFTKLSIISLGMIMGGIFGNLMDRIIYHSVIDYLSFGSFPIFNLADACICIGVTLLIIGELIKIKKENIEDKSTNKKKSK